MGTAGGGVPELSVVVCAAGGTDGLQACLRSLLADAPAGMELIVAGDAAAAAAASAAAAGAQLRSVVPAAGVAARQAGLTAARGTYVGFAEAADTVQPGWARRLLEAARPRLPAMVKGGYATLRPGVRQLHVSGVCQGMAAHSPLYWYGELCSALYRRDFTARHGLGFADGGGCGGEAAFQVRAVVAALLDGEELILCPQAVYCSAHHAGSEPSFALADADVESVLQAHAGLHELLCTHCARLPPAGIGVQYYSWVAVLLELARRAASPAAAVAAIELVQRLYAECPLPGELWGMMRMLEEHTARSAAAAGQRRMGQLRRGG